jgi:hypothetical protein
MAKEKPVGDFGIPSSCQRIAGPGNHKSRLPIEQLTNLPKFRALFRTDSKVFAVQTPAFLPRVSSGNAVYVRNRTLDLYGC